MSIFKKLFGASESGELKKIRIEAEQRRSAKSSQSLPKVEEDAVAVKTTIKQLSRRIITTEHKKPPDPK